MPKGVLPGDEKLLTIRVQNNLAFSLAWLCRAPQAQGAACPLQGSGSRCHWRLREAGQLPAASLHISAFSKAVSVFTVGRNTWYSFYTQSSLPANKQALSRANLWQDGSAAPEHAGITAALLTQVCPEWHPLVLLLQCSENSLYFWLI